MLQRYQTLFGPDRFEGHGLQAALPPARFRLLSHSALRVSFESFASPLNCFFPQYCSAFLDTDWCFGSCGSFFSIDFKEGSFEANPPFTEEAMEALAMRLEHLLAASQSPLSFVVIFPYWTKPLASSIALLQKSKFRRQEQVLVARQHRYVSGGQHLAATTSRFMSFDAAHDTIVFLLQNEAGTQRWPAEEGLLAKLT